MNMQNFNGRITQKVIQLNSYITTARLGKKIKVILLAIFVLSPSLAYAKMIKIEEGSSISYINEMAIISLASVKNGCELSYSSGSMTKRVVINSDCEQYIKEKQIEVK
jgi:hypothetical protein